MGEKAIKEHRQAAIIKKRAAQNSPAPSTAPSTAQSTAPSTAPSAVPPAAPPASLPASPHAMAHETGARMDVDNCAVTKMGK